MNKTYTWSVLLYGCEIWKINKGTRKKVTDSRDVVLEKAVKSILGN